MSAASIDATWWFRSTALLSVFHPKLYLTLDAKRVDTAVGSNNCTNAGIAYNVETCSTFTVKAEKAESTDVDAKSVIRQVFDAMRDFAADAGALRDTLEGDFLVPAEGLVPWLDRKVVLPKGNVTFVHSHRRPLWTQLRTKLQDLRVRKITIVSPFFDPKLGLVRKLRAQWPNASMAIVAQEDYATLPGNKVSTLLTQRHDVLFSAEIKPGRRLHAKTFALETNKGTHWIAGSANATSAAFEGGNTEAVLGFATTDEPSAIFEGGPLMLKKIDPKKFRAGKEQEPRNDRPATAGPTLDAAILEKAGRLVCQASGVEGLQQIAVRIRNFNEPAPVLAIPARFDRNGRSSISLDEDQIAQLRTATLCQLKGVDDTGSDILSNEMALAQLAQLLKERSGGGGPRSALQAITKPVKTSFLTSRAWEVFEKRSSSSTIVVSASPTAKMMGAAFVVVDGSRATRSSRTHRQIGAMCPLAAISTTCARRSWILLSVISGKS